MLTHEEKLDNSIFEEVFESTSNLVIVTDNKGCIVHTNNKVEQLFNAKCLGMPFWNCLGLECRNLDEALKFLGTFSQLPGTERKSYTYETNGVFYDINIIKLNKSDKTPKGFLIILNDITSLIKGREELERRVELRTSDLTRYQKMLQAVFQAVGKGILLIDDDREIIKSNQKACEIFGFHSTNLLGMEISTLFNASPNENLLDTLDSIIEGQIVSSEISAIYFDQSIFPAVFTLSVIIIDGHRLWIGIIEDITEQKSMELQLNQEKIATEEVNITLRNVLKTIQNEKRELTNNISNIIAKDILPALDKIKSNTNDAEQNGYIDFLGELLVSLTKGSESALDSRLLRLSKTEMKICKFIQSGFSSKEISSTINLAFDTIQTHRKNIRKKLGLSGSGDISLYGYLKNQKLV